jgi:leader peptidase (prepilin peptidase)/N-methyltransferase
MISSQISIKEKEDLVGFDQILIFVLGLIFGSFFNVLIYRLPLGISLINPKRSKCTTCNHTIEWYENIPVLSYVYLKGKCSSCNERISVIYPIVEILTAIVTVALYNKFGLTEEFYLISLIFYTLIILSFIDFRYKAVPDYLLIILVILTLSYLLLYNSQEISTFLIFAGGIFMIELFVTYYVQNIKSNLLKDSSLKDQKAMGEGDIPIIAVLGGILGLQLGVLAIFLGAFFAIIPSIVNLVFKKEIETPFIPYLSLGLFITYINKDSLLQILEGLK